MKRVPQRRIGEWWLELYTRNPAADANIERLTLMASWAAASRRKQSCRTGVKTTKSDHSAGTCRKVQGIAVLKLDNYVD